MFSITLHIKDLSLLETIQHTLEVGKISKSKLSAIYAVDSIKEIPRVLNRGFFLWFVSRGIARHRSNCQ